VSRNLLHWLFLFLGGFLVFRDVLFSFFRFFRVVLLGGVVGLFLGVEGLQLVLFLGFLGGFLGGFEALGEVGLS